MERYNVLHEWTRVDTVFKKFTLVCTQILNHIPSENSENFILYG